SPSRQEIQRQSESRQLKAGGFFLARDLSRRPRCSGIEFAAQMFRQFLDLLQLIDHVFREYPLSHLIDIRRNGLRNLRELIGFMPCLRIVRVATLHDGRRDVLLGLSLSLVRLAYARRYRPPGLRPSCRQKKQEEERKK